MDKRARRRECFARIKALTVEEKAAHSAAIVEAVSRSSEFKKAETVFAYISLSGEPDLEKLFEKHPEKRWAFSRVDADGLLAFHSLKNRGELLLGKFGIYEPDPGRCPILSPDEAELILIPGVSFDPTSGARLGRGKGHYDRYLSQFENRRPLVGICFSTQVSELEPEPHDVPMDAIVTETGWHNSVPRAD